MMKVNHSVSELYHELKPQYSLLKKYVDEILLSQKKTTWHYESRLKEIESFATKLEVGRVDSPKDPEDFFACTIVVENRKAIKAAKDLVQKFFTVKHRRPENDKITHLRPSSFDFDDLRLYCKVRRDESSPPLEFGNLIFEIQIKTYLQHAWGIATHDLIYKGSSVDWLESRVAFQVKALLEQAEMSIYGVEQKKIPEFKREDRSTIIKRAVLEFLVTEFQPDQLPFDIKRLADAVLNLLSCLDLKIKDLKYAIDLENNAGGGVNLVDLSPYSILLKALYTHFEHKFVQFWNDPNPTRQKIFIPKEVSVTLPSVSAKSKTIFI